MIDETLIIGFFTIVPAGIAACVIIAWLQGK